MGLLVGYLQIVLVIYICAITDLSPNILLYRLPIPRKSDNNYGHALCYTHAFKAEPLQNSRPVLCFSSNTAQQQPLQSASFSSSFDFYSCNLPLLKKFKPLQILSTTLAPPTITTTTITPTRNDSPSPVFRVTVRQHSPFYFILC